MSDRFQSFAAFYPFYLDEHSNRTCRRLHFVGTSLALAMIISAALLANAWFLPGALLIGYAFAWVGHFFYEKNRPATFKYPLYSFVGDWVMWKDMLIGRIRF